MTITVNHLTASTITTEVKDYVRNHPVALLCLTNYVYSGRDLQELTVDELSRVHDENVAKVSQLKLEVPEADQPQEVLNQYYHNAIVHALVSDEINRPFEASTIPTMVDELVERVRTSDRVGQYYAILLKSEPESEKFFDDMKALILE
ncbi:hypothetical protein CR5_067 [Cronobacter phage CR5]|uniref:hypothetical protein n=1 Tax=Cronobacter phage CR5 TaxID=1195085 RepID=UPI000342571D|nr:hypothetical protein CR5_067 [Cronobacter phage CR5]AFO71287.1 hypothetical protein CR5_067 [Cronobacter phage CR5]